MFLTCKDERVAEAVLCLITGHDCLASHLHRIGLRALCNEDEVMNKYHIKLCPSLTKENLSDRRKK